MPFTVQIVRESIGLEIDSLHTHLFAAATLDQARKETFSACVDVDSWPELVMALMERVDESGGEIEHFGLTIAFTPRTRESLLADLPFMDGGQPDPDTVDDEAVCDAWNAECGTPIAPPEPVDPIDPAHEQGAI